MGEVLALLRFDGLYFAGVIGLEHDASAILGINERETASVALQVTERIDKIFLFHAQELGNGCNILICKADITLPAAAGATTLASMYNGGCLGHVNGESPTVCGLLL